MGALAASAVGGALGMIGQNQTNQANVGMMNASENWMERMSDTAHQREVSDLKAAGLNPILSAGGNGASTPSIQAPNMTSPLSAGTAAANSSASTAMSIMKGIQDIKTSSSQAKLAEANAVNAGKDAGVKSFESDAMSGLDSMMKKAVQNFSSWYQNSGLRQTSARFEDSLTESPKYMTQDQARQDGLRFVQSRRENP